MGHIEAISPKLAVRQRLHRTQKMNPYKKATEPPDGITMPSVAARQIHVLRFGQLWSAHYIRSPYFKIAKLKPTMFNLLNLGFKCPARGWTGSREPAADGNSDACSTC